MLTALEVTEASGDQCSFGERKERLALSSVAFRGELTCFALPCCRGPATPDSEDVVDRVSSSTFGRDCRTRPAG